MFFRSDSKARFIVENDRLACIQKYTMILKGQGNIKPERIKNLNGFTVVNDEVRFYKIRSSEIEELEKRNVKKKKIIASAILFINLFGVSKVTSDVMDFLGIVPQVQSLNPNSFGTAELRNILNMNREDGIKVAVIDYFGKEPVLPKVKNIVLTPEVLIGKDEEQDHGENVMKVIDDTLNDIYKGNNPNIKIMPIGLDSSFFEGSMSKAIKYAADSGAKVINISMYNPNATELYEINIQNAIDYAYRKGSVVVVAAGNSQGQKGIETENYPSMLNHTLSVTAQEEDENDRFNRRLTDYSRTNEATDFTAWGTHYIVRPNGGVIPFEGTSSAAPEVSAKIASIYEMLIKKYSVVTPDMVIMVAKNSADSKDDRTHEEGYGMIDIKKAGEYIEQTILEPKEKGLRPPRVVWSEFDNKTSQFSFEIISEDGFFTTNLRMKVIGQKLGSNNKSERFVVDGIKVKKRLGVYTADLSQFPDGKYSVEILGIEDYNGRLQDPIFRKFNIDRSPVKTDISFIIANKKTGAAIFGKKGKGDLIFINAAAKDEFGTTISISLKGENISGKTIFPNENGFSNITNQCDALIYANQLNEGDNLVTVKSSDDSYVRTDTIKITKLKGEISAEHLSSVVSEKRS